MIETLGGLQLIRAFGRENQEQHRFALASSAVSKAFSSWIEFPYSYILVGGAYSVLVGGNSPDHRNS